MLDEQWLKDVRFDLGEGYRVDGIRIGGKNAVIKIIYPDGQKWAIRFPRYVFRFASYIRELPNWIAPVPQYDVDRLNRKLANIVGEPEIHRIVHIYDTFYYSILESLFHAREEDPLAVTADSDAARDAWRFIIQTPPVGHRLESYASSRTDGERRAWAEASLRHLKQAGAGDPALSPETLFDNPLVVWGGAVSEGFFTKAELPEAVAAVRQYPEFVLRRASANLPRADGCTDLHVPRHPGPSGTGESRCFLRCDRFLRGSVCDRGGADGPRSFRRAAQGRKEVRSLSLDLTF